MNSPMKPLALLAFLALAPSALAQPTWTAVEGLAQGAASVDFNARDPWTVWFGATEDGLFVSRDGGRSARLAAQITLGSGRGSVTAIFVHPADTSFVLVGSTGGAYLSRDGGQTWAHALPDQRVTLNGLSVAVEPGRPDTLYVAVFSNVSTPGASFFRSFDRGLTWERRTIPVGSPNGGLCALVAGGDGGVLAGSNVAGGLLRSEDYGETWAPVYTAGEGSPFDVPRALFDPHDPTVAWAPSSASTPRSSRATSSARPTAAGRGRAPPAPSG